jgi:plasmid maintenance system killer protein
MIDDAMDDRDLRVPPSDHFEKLRSKLEATFDARQQPVAPDLPLG